MFLLPFSYWVGGVLYEHSHRLFASFVGFLTIILMLWLWLRESRRWLRWCGVLALVLVILQGVLGGLRVTQLADELGIVHATLAQLFLVMISAMALVTSRWWQNPRHFQPQHAAPGRLPYALLAVSVLILVQLILGATMRHQHAGLAIPDFPLAYGRLWPPTDPEFLQRANQSRLDIQDYAPITAFHVHLHMIHRIVAVMILIAVGWGAWLIHQKVGPRDPLRRWAWGWWGLIWVQALLGAATVWSNKAADIATLHVLMGALSLNLSALLTLVAFRYANEWKKISLLTKSEKKMPFTVLRSESAETA
jgi:cytochrome c oxidase assembly protein subunit 15